MLHCFVLKVEKGAMSQEKQEACRRWKRQGNELDFGLATSDFTGDLCFLLHWVANLIKQSGNG